MTEITDAQIDAIFDGGEAPAVEAPETEAVEAPAENENTEAPAEAVEETTATPEEAQVEEKTDDFAERFAQLSKKDARLRKMDQEIKQHQKIIQEYDEFKAAAQTDPVAFLGKAGVDIHSLYESLTQKILAGDDLKQPQPQPQAQPPKEVTVLQQRLQQLEEQNYQSQVNALVGQIKADEKYEYINTTNAHQSVIDVITQQYNQGEPVSWMEAADMVEAYLEKQAELYAQTNRFKSKYLQQQTEVSEKANPSVAPATPVLNNKNTISTLPNKDEQQLSDEERFEQALGLLER